jgi:hypothetical protein
MLADELLLHLLGGGLGIGVGGGGHSSLRGEDTVWFVAIL